MYTVPTITIVATLLNHIALATSPRCDVDIGFDPLLVASQAQKLSTHSWEYGTLSQALLELYSPDLTAYSHYAFPHGIIPKVPYQDVPSLDYAAQHIRLNTSTLIDGDGATGDPASLGVSALLIGQTDPRYLVATQRQYDSLLAAPRWSNGAISHREESVELWTDFIAMAPPFMAYYAAQQQNLEIMREVVEQIALYRSVLQVQAGDMKGAWRHIMTQSPRGEREDLGVWSTGNAWVLLGMVRVLATIVYWGSTKGEVVMQKRLMSWIGEILAIAVQRAPRDGRGLLRNYWDDSTWFGEISGSAGITAAIYRVAMLEGEMGWQREKVVSKVVTMFSTV